LLLEKRNGNFYLAIWIEQPSYDVDAKKELAVPEQKILVQTKQVVKMKVHHIEESGSMQSSVLAVGQTVNLSDRLTILEISPQDPR
jgi:hypothetical protein